MVKGINLWKNLVFFLLIIFSISFLLLFHFFTFSPTSSFNFVPSISSGIIYNVSLVNDEKFSSFRVSINAKNYSMIKFEFLDSSFSLAEKYLFIYHSGKEKIFLTSKELSEKLSHHNFSKSPFTYFVSLPIHHGARNYADFRDNYGAIETIFLFPFPQDYNSKIRINFFLPRKYCLETPLTLSYFVNEKIRNRYIFDLKGDDKREMENFLDGFFIFGILHKKERNISGVKVSVVSSENSKLENYSPLVFNLFDFYSQNFMSLSQRKYIFGVDNSTGIYMAHKGGFFFPDSSPKELIAHEMFHSFYTNKFECGNLWIDEGLTTFMQEFAFYKIGIYSREKFEKKFQEEKKNIGNLRERLSEYNISFEDIKNKEKLTKLREKEPELHHLFVYELGAEIWKEIYDSFENDKSFISFLREALIRKDCKVLEKKLEKFIKGI